MHLEIFILFRCLIFQIVLAPACFLEFCCIMRASLRLKYVFVSDTVKFCDQLTRIGNIFFPTYSAKPEICFEVLHQFLHHLM